MSNVWVPINSDRQLAAASVVRATDYLKRCRAAAGASGVCDVAVQALLTDLAGSGPILACCRMLVNIVVNVATELTPVTNDALQRALTVRPEAYASIIDDALLYTRDLDRIKPLLRYLFTDVKFSPFWTDLHSRLVLFAKSRPDIALETLRFLCDVHQAMRAASYPSLHPGFVANFHDEATLELIDAVFDIDIHITGAGPCFELASHLVGVVLNRLCNDRAVISPCRILLHLFSLDLSLANDVRIIAVLSWVLRFHSGLQSDRDFRFLLETVFICVHSFDGVDIDLDFIVAITTLLPPLLELLSSNSEWPAVLSRASVLFDDLQVMRNRPVSGKRKHGSSFKPFIDIWDLEALSSILHVFDLITSSWSILDQFIQECSKKPCTSEYSVRAARFILDTCIVGSDSRTFQAAAIWMQELTKAYALELLPLFSAILYRLRNDRDGFIRIQLLYALPYIARSPIGLTRVLRIILPLTQHTQLRALSIRLLAQLWLIEPRSFSRLQQALLETRSGVNTVPIKRAVSASLIDICRESPSEALTLVPLLQSLLYDKDSITIGLSISALRELCVQGELDLHVAYKLLEDRSLRQYCVRKNPTALQQLFRLLECDDVEKSNDDEHTMLRWLWLQTSPASSLSAELRLAAYQSLISLAGRCFADTFAPNYVIRFFSNSEITRELFTRLLDERSGRVRAVLERFIGIVCSLQQHHRPGDSKNEPVAKDMEAFAVTFPIIVKETSKCVANQWRTNERPSVRNVFALSTLIGWQRDTPLSDLVTCIAAPNLTSATGVFTALALPAAWCRYMDRFASDLLRQKRDSLLTGSSLYLAVFKEIEDVLHCLDLGDSQVRGNVVLAKAGLAAKAGAWGHLDVATRLHGEILSVANDTASPILRTTRPAAVLALGVTIAALHATDRDRRRAAFQDLFLTIRSSSDEQIVMASILATAIASTSIHRDDDDAGEFAAFLQEELFELLYGHVRASVCTGAVATTAGIALWMMWPVLVRVISLEDLIAVHAELLQNARFGVNCDAAFYCLGGLSFRLFAMGIIDVDKLGQVVDAYVDEVKKPSPLPGALTSSASLLVVLRFASNYAGLPKSAPQQLGARLAELTSQADAQPEVISAAIMGFVALLGIDILMPFQGSRLPTDLCSHAEFTINVTEIFVRSLTVLATSVHSSPQVAAASALCLVSVGSAASWTARATDSQRVISNSALLRLISDSVERRSVPSNSVMTSMIRSICEIRRCLPTAHLPLPVSALSSLLAATTDDASVSSLALRTNITKLMLWQASHDNTLKRSVATLIVSLSSEPVCVQRVVMTGLSDVALCVDSDSVIDLLNSMPLSSVDSLLTGLRRVLENVHDQSVRDCAVQLLRSERLRLLISDVPRYASCFTSLSPEFLETILPVTDDVSILARLELVRKHVLSFDALNSVRTFIVGPQAVRIALVDSFANVCAESIPLARRLTWILDLFDLMAVTKDPSLVLRAMVATLSAWAHPLLPATVRTLAGSLPKVIEKFDDMSVDSVIRRLLRIVHPSKDDIAWSDDIRRLMVPSLISLASTFPRCAPVITSELFSII